MQSKDPHGEFIFNGVEIYPLTTSNFWVNPQDGETKMTAQEGWLHTNCRPIDLQRYVIVDNQLQDYRTLENIRNINAVPLFHTSGG